MSDSKMLYSLKVGAFLARFIPRKIGLAIVTFFALLYGRYPGELYKRIGSIHKRVSPHLSSAQMKKRIREVIASYGRYWWDVFWLSSPRSSQEITNLISTENEHFFNDVIRESKQNNTGIIVALPHMGSWEIPGAWFASQGYPLVAVAERLKPPELFDLFTKTRTSVGIGIIAHDDHPTSQLLDALNEGKVIVLVADRDISKRGVPIKFFGDTKTMPTGPASLSIKTGAPIMPLCTYENTSGKIDIVFGEPIYSTQFKQVNRDDQVLEITKKLAEVLEDFISRDPAQWHVLHDEWSR